MAGKREKVPIMNAESERFMAFEGLVQWTAAVVAQGKRVAEATSKMVAAQVTSGWPVHRRDLNITIFQ